jgi:small conductance mechanosensitive channel
MDVFWQQLRRLAELYAGHILGAAAIVAVGFVALRYLVAPLRRLMERSRIEPSTTSFLANSLRGLLLVVIVIAVLQQLGVETTSLLTVLATAGVAVALSLQNTLANFTAGLILLSFRLLRVGDVIESGPMRGRVTEMLPFHVILLTADNQMVAVPNSVLVGSGFVNHTTRPTRRAQWLLPVRSTDDLAAAKAALVERLLADARVLREPAPRAFVQEWGDDKRVLAVQAWTATADHPAAQEELLEALGQTLERLRPAASRPEPSTTPSNRETPHG